MTRPDIVITCDHGHRGGPAPVVQRFRWSDTQDCWLPGRRSTGHLRELRGDNTDTWAYYLAENPEDHPDHDAPLREHIEIRCGIERCRNAIRRRGDLVDDALTVTVARWPRGDRGDVTLSIDQLRDIIDRHAQTRRRAGH